MRVLVTGAKGFVGKNLTAVLRNIRDGKDRTHSGLRIGEVLEYDRDSAPELLEEYCRRADFVFHLAGVNRPEKDSDFLAENAGFTKTLLNTLSRTGNACPVMLASSVHAARKDSPYGASKLAAEELLLQHGRETGARVQIYRLPNLFGKWCRPNYNSVVATFCHNTARGIPLPPHDRGTELDLLYIDDLVETLVDSLENGKDSGYCRIPETHRVTLGKIADLLQSFRNQPESLVMPSLFRDSFGWKLYSVYQSCLPAEGLCTPLKTDWDSRGGFTELLKTQGCGQFSLITLEPGAVRGEHWHRSKWEMFLAVAGSGLVRMRKLDTDTVLEFPVTGDCPETVRIPPGYTHSIQNPGGERLAVLVWANEIFDPEHPDTFAEPV